VRLIAIPAAESSPEWMYNWVSLGAGNHLDVVVYFDESISKALGKTGRTDLLCGQH